MPKIVHNLHSGSAVVFSLLPEILMMGLAQHFKESAKGEEFASVGYTILPCLEQKEISRLKQIFTILEPLAQVDKPFYTSIWSENVFYRKEVFERIESILFPKLCLHIDNIAPVFSIFMVKHPGENSDLLPHQDWSFVDEQQFDTATVWIPLDDVSEENGNLMVVPRSHLQYQNFVRARFEDAPFHRETEGKKLINLPMKAGEALLINSRIIHGSPPNFSENSRLAASIVIAPAEAKLFHWVCHKGNLCKYEVEKDFFWRHNCFEVVEKNE